MVTTIPYKKNEKFMLAGDVGGTKTVIGIFRPVKNYPEFHEVRNYSSGAYQDLESVIEDYLSTVKVPISAACFGIAGPVESGRCRTTNIPWEISENRLRNKFSWSHVHLVNDLAAVGYATRVLKDEDIFVLQKGNPGKDGVCGVVAPGTGLGMSLMVKTKDNYIPISSEGGHTDFAPNREEEVELWRYLHEFRGHVSVERIVSGPGLVNIYRWLISRNREEEPSWLKNQENSAPMISEAAIRGDDPLCRKALEMFVSVLGTFAGNVALIGLTRGGIYLGGGILPKIMPFLTKENFLNSFCDKGRFSEFLKNIPVYVILNEQAGLLGAAVYLCSA